MESESDRFGLSSSLYAVCDSCGMKEFLATGYHNATDTVPRSIQGKDINRRIVYASYEMGVDSHKMPMSQLMPLFGTFALNINGLVRNELQLHLRQQPYISALARKQNMMSWTRLALVWEPTLRLKAKGEIQRECHRQKREFRNSIKNTDWSGAKHEKGMKT